MGRDCNGMEPGAKAASILVVDDDVQVCELLRQTLSLDGYHCRSANSGGNWGRFRDKVSASELASGKAASLMALDGGRVPTAAGRGQGSQAATRRPRWTRGVAACLGPSLAGLSGRQPCSMRDQISESPAAMVKAAVCAWSFAQRPSQQSLRIAFARSPARRP